MYITELDTFGLLLPVIDVYKVTYVSRIIYAPKTWCQKCEFRANSFLIVCIPCYTCFKYGVGICKEIPASLVGLESCLSSDNDNNG